MLYNMQILVDEYEAGENVGVCEVCGETNYDVEINSHGGICGHCSRPTVIGIGELLLEVCNETT